MRPAGWGPPTWSSRPSPTSPRRCCARPAAAIRRVIARPASAGSRLDPAGEAPPAGFGRFLNRPAARERMGRLPWRDRGACGAGSQPASAVGIRSRVGVGGRSTVSRRGLGRSARRAGMRGPPGRRRHERATRRRGATVHRRRRESRSGPGRAGPAHCAPRLSASGPHPLPGTAGGDGRRRGGPAGRRHAGRPPGGRSMRSIGFSSRTRASPATPGTTTTRGTAS